MHLRNLLSNLFSGRKGDTRRLQANASKFSIEQLEARIVLYAASGNAWPNPELITISFEPDGTNLGGVYSNLNSVFNSNPDLAGWQSEIVRAAQVWAAQTDINFLVVSDSGAGIGSGSYQQGSTTIGDIRIGGFDFQSSTLADALYPAPDNTYSSAGDIAFNTAAGWSIGGVGGYDLFTVAVHEIGHALGLAHSSTSAAEMYGTYTNAKPSLNSDDISGIRNIYSSNNARDNDKYDKPSTNNTWADASNITGPLVRAKKWAIIDDLDITSSSDVDYYKVSIPNYAGSTLTVRVQSAGLSLLAPKATLYNSAGTVISTATGSSSSTLTLSVSGISNNDWYYIRVEGATGSAFNTGAYGLTLDIGADSTPQLTMPNTQKANGSPIHSGGQVADSFAPAGSDTVAPAAPTISVAIATPNNINLIGTAEAHTLIAIYQDGSVIGTAETDATGSWSYKLSRKLTKGIYQFSAVATDEAGNVSLPSALQIVSIRTR
ncbi:MAG: putative Zn-dependent protease [Planctomycetaceae bacterium]|nr:putative Zn-dependent protease [Planctomycetaceae bacterium]